MSNKTKNDTGEMDLDEAAAAMTRAMEAERDAFTDALLVSHGVDVTKMHPEIGVQLYPDTAAVHAALRAALTDDEAKEGLAELLLAQASIASEGDGVANPLGEVEAKFVMVDPYVLGDVLRHVWSVAYGAGARNTLPPDHEARADVARQVVALKRDAIGQGKRAHLVEVIEHEEPGVDHMTSILTPLH